MYFTLHYIVGGSFSSPLLKKICGIGVAVPKEKTSNTMILRLHSNVAVQYEGFKLKYIAQFPDGKIFLANSTHPNPKCIY